MWQKQQPYTVDGNAKEGPLSLIQIRRGGCECLRSSEPNDVLHACRRQWRSVHCHVRCKYHVGGYVQILSVFLVVVSAMTRQDRHFCGQCIIYCHFPGLLGWQRPLLNFIRFGDCEWEEKWYYFDRIYELFHWQQQGKSALHSFKMGVVSKIHEYVWKQLVTRIK